MRIIANSGSAKKTQYSTVVNFNFRTWTYGPKKIDRTMSQLINLTVFKNFFKSSNAGGILLFICVIISLIIANTAAGPTLQSFLDTSIGFDSDKVHLKYSILLWINDGLMAIFFLLVGL